MADPLADAVVVAAGASRRMDGIDKLAHVVAGRPLLAWSIDALTSSGVVGRVVVVTSRDRVAGIRDAPWLPPFGRRRGRGRRSPARIRRSGSRRARRAATIGSSSSTTAPGRLATPELVAAVARAAAEHGAAIPVLPVAETLKRVAGDVIVETVDRSGLAAAQTPQGARASLLRSAFERFPPSGPAGLDRRGRAARGL